MTTTCDNCGTTFDSQQDVHTCRRTRFTEVRLATLQRQVKAQEEAIRLLMEKIKFMEYMASLRDDITRKFVETLGQL